jgi:dipeptidyl aminopeptidase/acylaminoacyl peptidase
VAGNMKHQPATAGPSVGPYGVPAYYVALITANPRSDVQNDLASSSWTDTAAELRSTRTGAVLAKVTPPRPYVSFTGVTAAADDRTFVVSAQGPLHSFGVPSYPAQRFFVLRIDPAARDGARMTLTALPAGYVPAGDGIHDMALSPDGTRLAADIGADPPFTQALYVFDLATGTERAWSFKTCASCHPSSGGLGFGGTNVDALSWTADGKHVAFVGPNRAGWPAHSTVRLLDVTLPGSDLLADSRPIASPPPGTQLNDVSWRGAIITPDGRTVVIVEEDASNSAPLKVRDRLLKISVATGRVTVVNDLNVLAGYLYEQVMYSDASGSVLVVSGARKGWTAGILRGDRYTPIPWDRHIATAIW